MWIYFQSLKIVSFSFLVVFYFSIGKGSSKVGIIIPRVKFDEFRIVNDGFAILFFFFVAFSSFEVGVLELRVEFDGFGVVEVSLYDSSKFLESISTIIVCFRVAGVQLNRSRNVLNCFLIFFLAVLQYSSVVVGTWLIRCKVDSFRIILDCFFVVIQFFMSYRPVIVS